ncbi:serine/threonine-protein phosphatase 7 long form-like protein [Hibiscus syriacus]|uniref:Serine/threonine-protein phosphatase 7 long form-like protein n=1 Tax=Hibiscus syriacus TaxID=106335 RepID=A0A6A2Y1H9_HIBSY|nr:serine/threonine-protein phosphatase 7 long form-like protein [Hibiscus syriacus]
MAAGAANELFRSLYEGCLSGSNIGIEHRPYHRNCHCALHDKSLGNCSHASPKRRSVSYPIRRARSEGSLAMEAPGASFCRSSPSLSPA